MNLPFFQWVMLASYFLFLDDLKWERKPKTIPDDDGELDLQLSTPNGTSAESARSKLLQPSKASLMIEADQPRKDCGDETGLNC